MPKSEFSGGLDDILQPVTASLKHYEFRKGGRSYNRMREDGVIHVIGFQMGQFPIGDYVIPGVRESYYGKFAINLGVFLPCVVEVERGPKSKRFFQDYDCQIRSRLRSAPAEDKDQWWEIKPPYFERGQEIAALIETTGMPFLDKFTSYRSVLDYFEEHRKFPFQNPGRSALEAAILYRAVGNSTKSIETVAIARSGVGQNPRFADYVATVERKMLSGGTAAHNAVKNITPKITRKSKLGISPIE